MSESKVLYTTDPMFGSVPPGRVVREPVVIPFKDKVTSWFGFGPMPWRKGVKVRALVDEANRLDAAGLPFPLLTLTDGEQAVRRPAETRAQNQIKTAVNGPIKKLIEHIKVTAAKITDIDHQRAALEHAPLLGPSGEALTEEQAKAHHEQLRQDINDSIAAGSKKHLIDRHRRPKSDLIWTIVDTIPFILAALVIFNVSIYLLIGGDIPTIINAILATILAVLGSLGLGVLCRWLGRRHRPYKMDNGAVDTRSNRWILLELLATGIAVTAAAGVMFGRVFLEGLEADAPAVLMIALSVLLAAVVAHSVYRNYISEFGNGSDATDRLTHLAAVLNNRQQQRLNLDRARTTLIEEAGIAMEALARAIVNTNEKATTTITHSAEDRAIICARSYHLATSGPLPAPELDRTGLKIAAAQAQQFNTHQPLLPGYTNQA